MNKLKGSLNVIKMKYILIAFGVLSAAAIALRAYQLIALVESSTGFFLENNATIVILYVLLGIGVGALLVTSFMCGDVPSPKPVTGKNPLLAIASFVAAGGFVFDAVNLINKHLPQFNGNFSIFLNLLNSNIKESGGVFIVLEIVFALLSVMYALIYGFSHINGMGAYKKYKTLALSPLFWAMSLLVSRLMQPTAFIKVSETLFEIYMCVFLMLFLFTFARISTGVFTENSMWGIYGYGFAASVLGLVVTVPRIIVMAAGLNPVTGNEFNASHLTTVIFVVAYILSTLGVGFKDGVANRKTVNELELPDENVAVTKKDVEETNVVEE